MHINIADLIIKIPVLLFAITIHEYAHGKAAYSRGDPTAKNAGRLTLNPFSHLDPLGAICLFLFHFGWAKPVPIHPGYFQNYRRDTILISLSGPIANIAAAFVAGLFFRYLPLRFDIYTLLLIYLVIMNIGLGIFNLLPDADVRGQTAQLAAQSLWYFMEGVSQRKDEHPLSAPDAFKKFIVSHNDMDHDIIFYKSLETDRWWFEVPVIRQTKTRHVLISCSMDDYKKACNQEIPDRWLNAFQKLN